MRDPLHDTSATPAGADPGDQGPSGGTVALGARVLLVQALTLLVLWLLQLTFGTG